MIPIETRAAAWRPALLICAVLALLSGCSGPPNEDEAATAVRRLFGDAGNVMGAGVPFGAIPSSVSLGDCQKQDTPAGHICSVTVVTQEIPVIGAISIPMTLRFAKGDQGWQAYLN